MANAAMRSLPGRQRKALLANEARVRKSGGWGVWEKMSLPNGIPEASGWTKEFRTVYKNACFCVMERETTGGVRHLMISSLSGIRPTWWEAQRIKNELAGPTATAVEVYPPQADVIDQADAYHLWVLTAPLDFGIT